MNNQINEKRTRALQGVRDILSYIGEDIDRQGLKDTPKRFINSLLYHTDGYARNPHKILEKFFEEVNGYQSIILLHNIHFESMCEHHLAPVVGSATVGYFPNKKIVGLSKLARVVDVYSKRLQIQERLTSQIGSILDEVLDPIGVGVILRAKHNCLCTRGAYKPNAYMTTTYFSGLFDSNLAKKEEFYRAASMPWGEGVHHTQ